MNQCCNFISPKAKLGANVKVWHFAVILDDVEIGDNVSIGSHCEIGRGCKIGNNSRIGKGVFLPPKTVIGNDVFIGPGVYMADDKYPVVNNPDYNAQPPIIESEASIGLGAVILPGIRIGFAAKVGAGAVVTKDVPPYTTVVGVPADDIRLREFETY